MLAEALTAAGNIGLGIYNNADDQALKSYLAGKSLQDQKEIQQQMLALQTDAQKKAYTQSLIDKAKRQKNLPYWIAGGVLGVTLIIGLIVVFSKKNV